MAPKKISKAKKNISDDEAENPSLDEEISEPKKVTRKSASTTKKASVKEVKETKKVTRTKRTKATKDVVNTEADDEEENALDGKDLAIDEEDLDNLSDLDVDDEDGVEAPVEDDDDDEPVHDDAEDEEPAIYSSNNSGGSNGRSQANSHFSHSGAHSRSNMGANAHSRSHAPAHAPAHAPTHSHPNANMSTGSFRRPRQNSNRIEVDENMSIKDLNTLEILQYLTNRGHEQLNNELKYGALNLSKKLQGKKLRPQYGSKSGANSYGGSGGSKSNSSANSYSSGNRTGPNALAVGQPSLYGSKSGDTSYRAPRENKPRLQNQRRDGEGTSATHNRRSDIYQNDSP